MRNQVAILCDNCIGKSPQCVICTLYITWKESLLLFCIQYFIFILHIAYRVSHIAYRISHIVRVLTIVTFMWDNNDIVSSCPNADNKFVYNCMCGLERWRRGICCSGGVSMSFFAHKLFYFVARLLSGNPPLIIRSLFDGQGATVKNNRGHPTALRNVVNW